VGATLRAPPVFSTLAYPRFSTLWMCVGMLASVPIPCRSIRPMSSASLSSGGASVVRATRSHRAIATPPPAAPAPSTRRSASGSGSSRAARQGIASVHPGSTTVVPVAVNVSPPASSVAVTVSSAHSPMTLATHRRAMKSYRRHASPPPMSDSVAGAAGVIGGWSPASVPREDARRVVFFLIESVSTDPTDPTDP